MFIVQAICFLSAGSPAVRDSGVDINLAADFLEHLPFSFS